jgi:hypothetical protein
MLAKESKEGRMELDETGTQRNEDAGKPHHGGNGAPPADPFAEERPRQQGDCERRQKADGGGLVEAQVTERKEVEAGRAQQQHRAHKLQVQFGCEQHARHCQQPQRLVSPVVV